MGIPSFYKHVIQSIAGLTSPTRPARPQFFGLDLNCAIYYCVRILQKHTPYTPETHAEWERKLIAHVISYIRQLVVRVQPTECLYIAVDGVAPMAKIRQQRTRRFKSARAADDEARVRAEAAGVPFVAQPRWDTNAITPGTAFMGDLAVALRAYAREAAHIVVSPADEPGEGEQKIVQYLRTATYTDAVIYGLDADLIVLAMLLGASHNMRVDLFREDVEFGGIKTNAVGETQYLYMDVGKLAQYLYETYGFATETTRTAFVYDFVGLMNFMGNDFVPHGMLLKIRDEGIETVLRMYKDTQLPRPIVSAETGQYNRDALRALFAQLARDEPALLLKTIRKKLDLRVGATHSTDPVDRALARYNDTPIVWAVETPLVERDERYQMRLRADWKTLYDQHALWGADPATAAASYVDSLAWTMAYYTGRPVNMSWYYPWLLPPRAESVCAYLETASADIVPPTLASSVDLTPLEQLAAVLPQSSFHLLPPELQTLDTVYPHAWPTDWGMYSFGRRFMWECEPLIPLVQPAQIKTWIETMYE